jgi:cell division protein FtsB
LPELKKSWIVFAIGLLVLASFAFNESLRATIYRKRKIAEAQAELEKLSRQHADLRQRINNVKSIPESHELLVRRELGYLRPGEKEIRFVKEEK